MDGGVDVLYILHVGKMVHLSQTLVIRTKLAGTAVEINICAAELIV